MLVPPVFVAPETEFPALSLVVITVAIATVVLSSIAFDLRRLRRSSRLRAIHGLAAAASMVVVVGGSLAMCLALGSVPPATANPTPSGPTGDITDPATDIQLPTLALDD